jgi:hypothetical protein
MSRVIAKILEGNAKERSKNVKLSYTGKNAARIASSLVVSSVNPNQFDDRLPKHTPIYTTVGLKGYKND